MEFIEQINQSNEQPNLPSLLNSSNHSDLTNMIREELSRIPNHNIDDFDFPVPQSQFNGEHPVIDLNAMTRPPDFDECIGLSRDARGNSRRLNGAQLMQLRELGEFKVPSQNFEGQEHTWAVSKLLQKGTNKIKESFYDNMASGTHQIIISIPNRIHRGKYVTLKSSLINLLQSFIDVPMILFGLSKHHKKYTAHTISWKLEEFANDKFVEEVVLNKDIGIDSFVVQSVNGSQIDLVIDKRDQLLNRLSPQYNAFKIKWENDKITRRSRLHQGLFNESLSEDQNIKHVLEEEDRIYLNALFELIVNTLDENDAHALISLIKNMNQYNQHMKEYNDMKEHDLSVYLDRLNSEHNIRSRIPDWVENRRSEFLDQWLRNHPIDEVYDKISNELEGQEKYIFDFKRNIKESNEYNNLKSELESETIPGKVFVFKFRIWHPSHWKVTNSHGYYTANKYREVKNSTSYPGWRFVNMALRMAKYFMNFNYYLLVNLWQGKFGLRSLVGLDEFYSAADVDTTTGTIKRIWKNSTWFGRIRDLWQNIAESRTAFERTPDTGLLGKSFTRIFNVLWNYGVKGVIGTTLCFVGHPLLVAVNTVLSAGGILTSPVWGVLLPVLRYLFDILIYDLDSPYKDKSALFPLFYTVFIKFLMKGIGQGLTSLLAIAGHGFVGTFIYLWGLISNGTRYLYDTSIYHLILKYRAKIPSENGFLVKRISGPGLSNQYFYLITHNLATVLIQYQLERMEMDAFASQMRNRINMPLQNLLRFYDQFKDVALVPDNSKPPISNFNMTKNELNNRLTNIMMEHWNNYNIKNNAYNADKIKLSRHDLLVTLETGKEMCRVFVTNKIYPRLTENEYHTFWNSKNLTENDWAGLAKYCLTTQFSNSISIPFEDTDSNGFHLVVEETYVSDFMRDLFAGHPSDGLDTHVVNPEIIDKLMNTMSDNLHPESVFNSSNVKPMSINKHMINEYNNHMNNKRKRVSLDESI
ncbi:hypothetical protein QKU48_gp0077 [Fadolivirus algeromassiliense]|jgi:hypothetical protein|uniref:Uncharacterized protein n=1 Tax=Fadolivirus FV1/VV64 TaxID=3070911 RepID=A0A7D3V553_9VIRU|nr:hypothetical protein QKU48_gp0077 [Fadolivirus algeromassiliense]QKF93535.1 hypothetical protein Fadolivirus_1_77 [Fadolivirus FV1/VV64]